LKIEDGVKASSFFISILVSLFSGPTRAAFDVREAGFLERLCEKSVLLPQVENVNFGGRSAATP
jgi:hypothetical protein